MVAFKSFYERIAPEYERVNRAVTLGLDRFWRRRAVRHISRIPIDIWLDMCTGTGETAIELANRSESVRFVLAADFSPAMLKRFIRKGIPESIRVLAAECSNLPIRDNSLDGISITFAVRNLNQSPGGLDRYFKECCRVIRPGGLLVLLETSQPESRLIRFFFHLFVRLTVVPISRLFSSETSPYQYLATSILCFYDADTLTQVLERSGFCTIKVVRYTWGVVALHLARKQGTPARSPE